MNSVTSVSALTRNRSMTLKSPPSQSRPRVVLGNGAKRPSYVACVGVIKDRLAQWGLQPMRWGVHPGSNLGHFSLLEVLVCAQLRGAAQLDWLRLSERAEHLDSGFGEFPVGAWPLPRHTPGSLVRLG